MKHHLTPETANRFAEIALSHVGREYPHKLDHVMEGPEDVLGPRALHPIFFGSFDWHSCVHGYWLLMRTLRLHPDMAASVRIRTLLDEMMAPDKVAGELAYLDRAYTGGFERPYGWAWLLALHREAQRHEAGWADALAPLACAFAGRFGLYLPKLTYPIRTGTHPNTAFAMILARQWAEANDGGLAALIGERAHSYYGGDRACPGWEPAGDDFLSPALTEALLMRRVLAPGDFSALVRRLPARSRRGRAQEPVHARLRLGPVRRQDRPSRRSEPEPGLVLARPCRRARPRSRRSGAWHRRCPSRRQPAPCRGRLYGRALAGDLRLARARRRRPIGRRAMNHLYLQLGRAIAGTCPPGFKEARLDAAPDEDRFDIACTLADGSQAMPALDAEARQGIGAALAEVRQAMAGPDGKSWRSCTVTLVAGGGFSMEVTD